MTSILGDIALKNHMISLSTSSSCPLPILTSSLGPGVIFFGGCRGVEPPARGFGGSAPEFFFSGRHIFSRHISGTTYFSGRHIYRDDIFPGPHDIRWFSAHGFLPMVF
jgi:hypothetical protein